MQDIFIIGGGFLMSNAIGMVLEVRGQQKQAEYLTLAINIIVIIKIITMLSNLMNITKASLFF